MLSWATGSHLLPPTLQKLFAKFDNPRITFEIPPPLSVQIYHSIVWGGILIIGAHAQIGLSRVRALPLGVAAEHSVHYFGPECSTLLI